MIFRQKNAPWWRWDKSLHKLVYKPSMRGGHTHNHVKNVEKRSKRLKEKV